MAHTNWASNLTFSAARIAEPTSLDELRAIVAASASAKAIGSRHSFTTVADTTGTHISLAQLCSPLSIDAAARTVTVDAGCRYGAFVEELDTAGWALGNLASLPHISVAGAIATGTHGSGDGNSSLAAAVAGLELVTAAGDVLTVRRGDADFDGMVVSLGALGIVTRVTLDIVERFDVRQDVFEKLPWDALIENFDAITASAYSVSLFTHWGDEGVSQAWLKSRTDSVGTAATAPQFFGATAAVAPRHPLEDGPADNTTQQFGVPGAWWDRLPHFKLDFTPSNGEELQTEYLVPRSNAVEAIEAMRSLAPIFAQHLFVSELRTVAADTLWLSPAHDADCVGIHFTWKQHIPEVLSILPLIDDALAPLGGRAHWGKLATTDAARIATAYPRVSDFRDLASRLDPAGIFRNEFLDRMIF